MFSNDTIDTYSIPIMVVKNLVPLPNNEMKFDVLTPYSLGSIRACQQASKEIGIFVQRNPLSEDVSFNNLQPVGVVGQLTFFLDGGAGRARILGIVRARLNSIEQDSPYLVGNVTSMPKINDDVASQMAYVKLLVNEIEKNGPRLLGNNRDLITMIAQGVTPDKLCDILAFNIKMDLGNKLKYLQTPSVSTRLRYLVEDVKAQKILQDLDNKIE